jgi:Neprosin
MRPFLVTHLSLLTAALSACAYVGCSAADTKEPSELLDTHGAVQTAQQPVSVRVPRAAVQTAQQPESVRVQALLDHRYKAADVRHSFTTKFGETVDCIDFFAQPGVKRLAALGQPITELPPPAIDEATRASLPDDLFNGKPDEAGALRACPADTVPILRITAANIEAAGGVDAFNRAHTHKTAPENTAPHAVQPAGNPDPAGYGTAPHAVQPGGNPDSMGYGHVYETYNNTSDAGTALPIALGAATMNVWQPTVPTNVAFDHSLAQVWMVAGDQLSDPPEFICSFDCVQSVETGYNVDPTLYAPTSTPNGPHFFIFSTVDGYATGCYNAMPNPQDGDLTCDDQWVTAPGAAMMPGMALTPSIHGGTQVELTVEVSFASPSFGSGPGWVVNAGLHSGAPAIGYFPATGFNVNSGAMTTSASTFQVGGEIDDATGNMIVPIGSGSLATAGFGNAAYIIDFAASDGVLSNNFTVNGAIVPAGAPANLAISTTTPAKPGGGWQNYFYYGESASGFFETDNIATSSRVGLSINQGIVSGHRVTTGSVSVGSNGAVDTRTFANGSWGAGTTISATGFAPPTAGVAIGQQTSTQTDAFVVGNDGKVYVMSQTSNGPWSSPTALTSAQFAAPGALLTTATPGGQLAVLVVDTTGKLEVIAWTSAHGWAAPVAVTSAGYAPSGSYLVSGTRSSGEIDIFSVGNDGTLKYMFYNLGVWGGPFNMTGSLFAPPGATIATALDVHGYLNVMTVGNTGALYTDWDVTPLWSGATAITGIGFAPAGGGVAAVNLNSQSINAFVVDNTGSVNTLSNAGSSWAGPTVIAPYVTNAGATVTAVAQGTTELDAYTVAPGVRSGIVESIDTNGTWATPVALP